MFWNVFLRGQALNFVLDCICFANEVTVVFFQLFFLVLSALLSLTSVGFSHLLPWYYMIYFIILLVHRDSRDMNECRRKYGSAWDEYCRTVRYRIIPRVYWGTRRWTLRAEAFFDPILWLWELTNKPKYEWIDWLIWLFRIAYFTILNQEFTKNLDCGLKKLRCISWIFWWKKNRLSLVSQTVWRIAFLIQSTYKIYTVLQKFTKWRKTEKRLC